ncbi:MAG: PfkB family carbohydrate kinase [Waltera sp.]
MHSAEFLIDAIAEADSEVHITGNAGGATPANVLACAANLDDPVHFISKAGIDDYIGRWLKKIIDETINTDGLILSPSKNTAIAMVSLSADNDDHFLSIAAVVRILQVLKEVSSAWILLIKNSRMFHFGSVSLTGETSSRSSTLYAAQYAREHNVIVSYDPNLRLNLWHSSEEAIKLH